MPLTFQFAEPGRWAVRGAKKQALVLRQVEDPREHLNPVVYQQGALVLHRLRQKIGRDKLSVILGRYYQRHQGTNTITRDFVKVVEELAGKEESDWLEGQLQAKSLCRGK